ncbi:MAG TPA: FlgD immunoglobulin-like domain containing protein, partial [Calditrichia bacterium]|nr:FlgD immunoglobulin-like domain containing protein [Calditrichia bacterium]
NPTFGVVPAGGSVDVQVIADATGLSAGSYRGQINIASNDPVTPDTSVAVNLTVGTVIAPQIGVTPVEISDSLAMGDSMDVIVEISNIAPNGALDLTWNAAVLNSGAADAIRTYQSSLPVAGAVSGTESSVGLAPRGFDAIIAPGDGTINNLLESVGSIGYGAELITPAWWRMPVSDFANPVPLGAPAGALFAGDFDDAGTFAAIDNGTGSLIVIDTANGVGTALGTLTVQAGHTWTGLTYDATRGTWFASSTDGASSALYTVDPVSVTATLVGTTTVAGLIIDIAAAPDGTIWAHDIGQDAIFTVDPATAAPTLIGATGFDANFAQGMDVDPATGLLYLAAYNNTAGAGELRLVDTSTGSTTLLASYGFAEIGAFGILPEALVPGPEFVSLVGSVSGTIIAGDTDNLVVRLYGVDVANDTTLTAAIEVRSNDPATPVVMIPVSLFIDNPSVGIGDNPSIPQDFAVSQNYPNPFNPTTTIAYQLPRASDVTLVIYNVLGQQVRSLVNARVEAGRFEVVWDGLNDAGSRVASGIYLYRFEAADFHQIHKMILLK